MENVTQPVETWRPAHIRSDLYEVSGLGRVRNSTTGLILKQGMRGKYPYVKLAGNVSADTHVLVCIAFHGPRPPGREVAHGDGNPKNNQASNLRWATRQENYQDSVRHGTHHFVIVPRGVDHSRAKLTESQVREIRQLASTGVMKSRLAVRFGVSQTVIGRVVHRKSWRHVA